MNSQKNTTPQAIELIGAGLVGSLLGLMLAQKGYRVRIRERRPDMRREVISAGRSINLAMSVRGFHALEQVGLKDALNAHALPMRGRMVHSLSGDLTLQPYGQNESECIYSVSRGDLNKLLMSAAENAGVEILFKDNVNALPDSLETPVIGTDGYASFVRSFIQTHAGGNWTETPLDYGYKELTIPPRVGAKARFHLEPNALHIWPRGAFMLIALPNRDGSFTCTLFLPWKPKPELPGISFEELDTPVKVRDFFASHFSDAAPLMEDLTGTFFTNPTGMMVTVKGSPWAYKNQALLMGDAAHAIVPFFGQGMNAGFEDCSVLASLMESSKAPLPELFESFWPTRKPDTDAIANMAVENFYEMRDAVANPAFQLQKDVERKLERAFAGRFISRYRMVSFTRTPYSEACRLGELHKKLYAEICSGLKSANDLDLQKADAAMKALGL